MPHPALQAVLACGEQIAAALDADDLDRVAALAAERDVLVAKVLEAPPVLDAEASAAVAEALAAQHRALTDALAARRATIADALGDLAQHRRAQTSYHDTIPRSPVLHPIRG
jgi:hypothetical protein